MVDGLDRVGAPGGVRSVGRLAANLEPKPDHPDLGAQHVSVGGFDDEAGVGPVAALEGRERPEAGALLLDHRLEVDPAPRREAGSLEGVEREERGDGRPPHPPSVNRAIVGSPCDRPWTGHGAE